MWGGGGGGRGGGDNQYWQSSEEGAGKRYSECAVVVSVGLTEGVSK